MGAGLPSQAAAMQQQQAAAAAALLASGYNGAASEVAPGSAAAMLSTFTQHQQQVAFPHQVRSACTRTEPRSPSSALVASLMMSKYPKYHFTHH